MELLHANASNAAKDFARTYVWALWLGAMAIIDLSDLGKLPFANHMATGPFALLPEVVQKLLLGPDALLVIQSLAIIFICATILFPRRVLFPVVGCGAITLIQCQLRGFGHVNHAEIVLLLAAYTLTYFDSVELFVLNSREFADGEAKLPRRGAALVAITAIFCLSYSLTGICRIADGGLALFGSGSLTAWHQTATLSPRYFDLSLGEQLMSQSWGVWLLEAGYPFVTLVEILAPLGLVSVGMRKIFLAVMIPFHAMTVMLMGILFWENLALFVLLFDITRILPSSKDARPLSRDWADFKRLFRPSSLIDV